MAKVIIEIEDSVPGQFECRAEFDPPIQRVEDATPAQIAASIALEALSKAYSVTEDDVQHDLEEEE